MAVKLQTIRNIKNYISGELEGLYPSNEIASIINLVLESITGLKQSELLADKEIHFNPETIKSLKNICKELKTGKPVQYVLGETIFYDCKIKLNNHTMIPRQETEELVDMIIKENRNFHGMILDIGTGSGCIAIALAKNIPGAKITAIDISNEALMVARENAYFNHADVSFVLANILNPDFNITDSADIIVSNPPYVMESEKKYMHINVLNFEPHSAIFVPDSDPLVYYRAIISFAEKKLNSAGWLWFEINEAIGPAIAVMLQKAGYVGVTIIKDINGKERFIKAKKDERGK